MSLIETIVAVSILAIALLLTIGPTVAAFRTLRGAKVINLAESVGQGRIELIQQLDFDEVGVSGATVPGSLDGVSTETVQGVTFDVVTTVDWVGSDGLDPGLLSGAGDGVTGQADFGQNYKWVTVQVTPSDGSLAPVVFSTAIAPPFVPSGDSENGTVTVELKKFEPVGSPTPGTEWPGVYLVSPSGAAIGPTSGIGTARPVFENVPPVSGGGSYRVRLGPSLSDVQSSGWRIHFDDLLSLADEIDIEPGRANVIPLNIYKPINLQITLTGPAQLGGPLEPVTEASLILGYGTRYGVLSSAEMDSPGHWSVSEFEGVPLVPGDYSIQVDAPGYVPYGVAHVSMPDGYPSNLVQAVNIELDLAPNNTAEMTFIVKDPAGEPIRGALVNISSDGYGPLVQTTDVDGKARYNLPVGSKSAPTVTVQSPHGHEELVTPVPPIVVWDTEEYTLALPAGRGLLRFEEGTGGYFQYLPFGSGANWSAPVLPNSNGRGSAALPGNSSGNQWSVRKVCFAGNNVVAEGTVTVAPNGTFVSWGAGQPSC